MPGVGVIFASVGAQGTILPAADEGVALLMLKRADEVRNDGTFIETERARSTPAPRQMNPELNGSLVAATTIVIGLNLAIAEARRSDAASPVLRGIRRPFVSMVAPRHALHVIHR